MAGPGVLKSSMREREFQAENLKSGRSIKRDQVSVEREGNGDRAPRANRCSCERLPPVPKRSDPGPVPYPPSRDNYIDYNAKHVAEVANYHEPKLQIVDSKDGHVMDLEKSGLVPRYSTKQKFGKVPTYLKNGQPRGDPQKDSEPERPERPEHHQDRRETVRPVINKEIEVLQKRWIELEDRLRLISFSRPDKRDAIEDELRSIEYTLRMAVAD